MKYLQSQGFYTLTDISNAIAMNKEEKTMSRILSEVQKKHEDIAMKPNRIGRTF